MKTSEVFKKTFGSLSETVKEVRCHHFLTLLCCGCRSTYRKTVGLLWLIIPFSQLSQKVILGCNFQLFSFSINLSILFWLCCVGMLITGSRGGESYRHREEDQGRCGGRSEDGHALRRVRHQRWRKTGPNGCIQGHLSGQERQHNIHKFQRFHSETRAFLEE